MGKLSKKDRKRIKNIIELFFFIPLIIIALVLYYFIDKEVSKRMVYLKTEIVEYMEKQLDRKNRYKIRYESISPSIFMYLEIRDLQILSLISQEDEILRIRNIKIKYNIFSLLFSDNPLTSVSEINISNTMFKFDLTPGGWDLSLMSCTIIDEIPKVDYQNMIIIAAIKNDPDFLYIRYFDSNGDIILNENDNDNNYFKISIINPEYADILNEIYSLCNSNDEVLVTEKHKYINAVTSITGHPPPGQLSERTEFQRSLLSRLTSTTYRFKITAKNVALVLYTDTALINSTNLFFTINNKGDSYEINLRKGTAGITLNNQNSEPIWFFSNFKIKGLFSSRLDRADLIVRILHLESNNFELEKQTFQVVFKDNNLRVVKIQDKAPVDIQLTLNLPTRDLVLEFKTENWKPKGMVTLNKTFKSYNQWLNSFITSSGNITYNLDNNFLDYTLSASILLNIPLLPPDIVISMYLYGNKEIANFKPLIVHSNLGTIDFTGDILFKNFFPKGFLRLVNVKAIQDKRISADFTLDRYEESLSLKGSSLYIGSSGFDVFNLDIYPRYSSLFFNLFASFAQSKYNDEISATGELVINPALSLRIDGNLRNIPTSHIYKLFTLDSLFSERAFGYLETLTMNSEFHISSDFKAAEYTMDSVMIQDQADMENYVYCTVKGTEKETTVDSIQAQWEKFNLTGNVLTRFHEKDKITFLSNLYLEGIPYGLTGYYDREQMFSIKGNYGLNVSVFFSKRNETMITANALKLPFPLSGEEEKIAYTSFSINSIFPDNGNWQIVSPSMIFYNLPVFRVKENELEVAFIFNKEELFLSEIIYEDSLSELSGQGHLWFNNEGEFKIHTNTVLTSRNTDENYSVSGSSDLKTVNVRVEFNNSPLERIGKYIISGSVSGNLECTGPLITPVIEGRISLVKGSLIGDHVGFNANFYLKEPSIYFDYFSIKYLDLNIDYGEGKYNKKDGEFEFSAVFKGNYFNKNIYSDLDFYGTVFNMDASEPFDNVFQKEFKADFNASGIIVDTIDYDPWSLILTKQGEKLNVDGGPNNVLSGTFMNNGNFKFEVKPPFPIQGFVQGNVTGNTIDSEIQRIWIDHKAVNVILGEDIIKFTRGSASGKNIKISGNFNDPDYTGTLLAEDITLSFFLSPLETESFQCTLLLNEKQVEMEEIAVQIGKNGIVYVDKGIFYIDHWLPVAYDLTFSSDEYIGLYCAYDFDSVKVNGYAVGQVNARGDKNTVWVDGNLTANYGTITLSNLLEVEETDEENTIDLRINLSLESGKKVEFDWPTVNFPVIKCYAEKGSKILISYDSGLDNFNMNGKVNIRGGEVFYFNRNFYLKSGNIVFNVVNPDEVDPTVTVRAELRELNDDKEEVKIYLIAENNRLSNFSPRFESAPTMTEYEIYELLGQSLEKRIEESGLGLSFVLLSSDVLSEAFIFRSFEQKIKEWLKLDLFSIRTHIIENILIDRVMVTDETEDLSANNPISLGPYLDNTTITIGQYIGDDLFISGLVRFKEVDYYTPETFYDALGLRPELEISLEWPTPFFNLEWTFNPTTQEHLNDLFLYLTDNTIKFEWSFTY